MKIGILTQPLHNNYGGILQNYALQTILRRMGHEVWTIRREYKLSNRIKYGSILKRTFLWLLGKRVKIRVWLTECEKRIIGHHTNAFVDEYIISTPKIYTTKGLWEIHKKFNFEAYVVGSDQVWRPRFSPCITNYFLDFVESKVNVKKIAYAASFGVDEWEFSEKEAQACQKLIMNFDEVSIREIGGLDICKNFFGIKAKHVLDPTMLLCREDYINLFSNLELPENSGDMFVYILDNSKSKIEFVSKVAQIGNLIPFGLGSDSECISNVNYHSKVSVFPKVEFWLKCFMDAKFVITDSFHGTVFSILFNKPFVTICNNERGAARFTSLLKSFNLEDRLISLENPNAEVIFKDLNCDEIDSLLTNFRDRSIEFLKRHLN